MGLFDTFVPQPALPCPVCRKELRAWQGYYGPCLLLVWTQGIGHPQATDLHVDVDGVALPDEFLIYSRDCACFDHGVEAVGRCVDGLWQSTEYLTAQLVEHFYYARPKAERSARADTLRKAGL
jgi:hypothetical protein